MKRILFFVILLVNHLNAQRIMFVGEKCKADFDVIFVNAPYKADICITMVSNEYEAGRSRTRSGCDNWFVVDDEWRADYLVRNVNSVVPGRKTLYVYRNTGAHYEPPLRDREDPRNNYDFDDYYYNGRREHRRSHIVIDPYIHFNLNIRR